MVEKHLVIDHLKFSYEGLLNSGELYTVISSWFFEKGWDWYEKINQEQVTSKGRQIRLVLEPWKSASDYYQLKMRVHLQMIDIKDVEVEHEGKKLQVNQGKIQMVIDGFVLSDRKDKWNSKPLYWFLSVILEKYFFRHHYEKMETWIKSDVDDLYGHIKSYLNAFKYTYQT